MKRITIPKFKIGKRHHAPPGAAPGTLIEQTHLPKPIIHCIVFDPDTFERSVVDSAALGAFIESVAGKNVWLDVQGLGDSNIIRMFGELLGLHPLVMEDIVHVHQRPKQEVYREYLFAVLRTLRVSAEGSIETEQISFVLKPNLLVTFQERPGDVSEPVRKRIREGKGLIRRAGADYLFYALVDAVVDNYFPVIETYEENMDLLDDAVREDPSPDVSRHIHGIRRQLRKFRRSVWPLRDMFAAFVRDDIDFIDEKTRLFFRDAHDHVILAVEFVEGARERASDLGDLYLSVVGEKTNRVMNLLTIIATIFIPLTFLCGVYGMNFDTEVSPYNMPELKWRYAYPVFWGVLIVIFVGMLWIFKRKGWIGKK